MNQDNSTTVKKNLYAILGVSPLASQEEIRTAFRQLSRNIHPDKQPLHVQVYANQCFSEVETAYRVLSNPQLRRAYDLYGNEGVAIIESGAEGLVRADDTEERIEEILRYISKRQIEAKAGQNSSFNLGIDLSSYIDNTTIKNKYLTPKQSNDLLITSPYIRNISINQFIDAQISPRDAVTIGGNTVRYENILFSSALVSWKHSYSDGFVSQLTGTIGNNKTVRFDLIKSLDLTTNGVWGIEYGTDGLGINLSIVKQLKPDLNGSIEWGLGTHSGVTLNLDNAYELGQQKFSIYLGDNTGLKYSLSRYIDEKHTLSTQLTFLADMTNIEVQTLLRKQIGTISRANIGVAVGIRGVFLNIQYVRGSMRFLLPIQLSKDFKSYKGILLGYTIPLSIIAFYYYYSSKYYKDTIKTQKEEESRIQSIILENKKVYSQIQVNMLSKLANRYYEEEKKNDGLIIVYAAYGNKNYIGYNKHEEVVDVTQSCRFLTKNGMLKLYAGTKQDYIGFYNPCKDSNSVLALYIRYINNGILYEKQVDDFEPLFLPSSTAVKIGIANKVE